VVESGRMTGNALGTVERAAAWLQANGLNMLVYLAIAAGLYLLFVGLRAALRKLVGRPEQFDPHSWREILARMLQRTRSFFLAAIAAMLVTLSVDAPLALWSVIQFFFTAAIVIQGAIWVREFILAIIARRAATEGADHSTLVSAMGVIRLIINVAVWAIAAILILDNIGVNVTALVAGLGIGGIAIGLAAQGIFSDLFAALSILFDKPFKRGDTINLDTLTGTVEAIGLKTTRIRAVSGEIVVISNAKLLESRIHNFALFNRRRVVLQFGVTYQTPPDVLASLPSEIERVIVACDAVSFDRAHLWNFGPSSVDVEVVFFVESESQFDMMQARHDVMLGIIRRLADLGVDFAYPTQMGFLGGVDGKPVDPLSVPPALQPAP